MLNFMQKMIYISTKKYIKIILVDSNRFQVKKFSNA